MTGPLNQFEWILSKEKRRNLFLVNDKRSSAHGVSVRSGVSFKEQ